MRELPRGASRGGELQAISSEVVRRPRLSINAGVMNRREWLRTAIIVGLLVLAILFAQSRRNCEIPGSTWIPCIWGTPLKQPGK
jgi:hypothetical protein